MAPKKAMKVASAKPADRMTDLQDWASQNFEKADADDGPADAGPLLKRPPGEGPLHTRPAGACVSKKPAAACDDDDDVRRDRKQITT